MNKGAIDKRSLAACRWLVSRYTLRPLWRMELIQCVSHTLRLHGEFGLAFLKFHGPLHAFLLFGQSSDDGFGSLGDATEFDGIMISFEFFQFLTGDGRLVRPGVDDISCHGLIGGGDSTQLLLLIPKDNSSVSVVNLKAMRDSRHGEKNGRYKENRCREHHHCCWYGGVEVCVRECFFV